MHTVAGVSIPIVVGSSDFHIFFLHMCRYSLFAVVNHSGSLHNGHYTCFIRPQQDQVRARLSPIKANHLYLPCVILPAATCSGSNATMPGLLGQFQSTCSKVKGKSIKEKVHLPGKCVLIELC